MSLNRDLDYTPVGPFAVTWFGPLGRGLAGPFATLADAWAIRVRVTYGVDGLPTPETCPPSIVVDGKGVIVDGYVTHPSSDIPIHAVTPSAILADVSDLELAATLLDYLHNTRTAAS